MARTLGRWRPRLANLLLFATFLLAIVGGPALYVSSVIADEDAFVAVADRAIEHPEVRTAIAESVTSITFEAVAADEALAEVLPDQLQTFAVPITRLATSQLTNAAFVVLDTEIAIEVRDSALREVHRQVTADSDEVVVDLRAVLVRTSREIGGPTVGAGVAKFVSDSDTGRFTLAEAGSQNGQLLAVVRAVPAIGGLVALLSLATLLSAILVAIDRRPALVRGGLALAAGAIVASIVVSLALYVTLGTLVGGSPIGLAIAEVVSGDFAQQQRGAVLTGLGLALIGLLLGNRAAAVALRSLPGDLWHRRPETAETVAAVIGDNPALARAIVWLGGLFAITLWSSPTIRVTVTIVFATALGQGLVWLFTHSGPSASQWRSRFGVVMRVEAPPSEARQVRLRMNFAVIVVLVFLIWPGWNRSVVTAFFALTALGLALLDLPTARRLAQRNKPAQESASSRPPTRRLLTAGVFAAVVAALGFAATTSSAESVTVSNECNGHSELCERRIDEVVFAGSHNAMSSTDLGWDLAMQTGDIVSQLDHGVRALLIDALYWGDAGSLDGGDSASASAVIEAALSEDQPRPGTWLCHGYCALGASDLTGTLTDIDLWLDANPREVLLIAVQDEISTADFSAAVEASGLIELVHTHIPGSPFPTLGELIEVGERVLVYAENEGQADSWYQNAWKSAFTETPFTFALRSEFSCATNRGEPDNPLFLINHWLTTGIPVREAAAVVNGRDALLDRVRTCEAERGRLPTILATDFVQTGDLIAVVDELNGITG